jgi:phosphatidylserine/phosphatidylglycerophosphate/cardiolipin synthase-like enzyme
MKLLVQPDAGIAPLVAAVKRARRSIHIAIFRFDLHELETALTAAAAGPVRVRALIANTNKGGDKRIRKLELRLLEAGVTVARTADDLVRYHGKYVVVDRSELWVLGFNSTHLDVFRSRSFGLALSDKRLVQEALALFDSDANREAFQSRVSDLVVSPENARTRLTAFIKAARRQLLVYDPKVSDAAMLRLLHERAKQGVDVRVLGKVTRRGEGLRSAKLAKPRLHVRAMVRDGVEVFVGSQSLRGLELDRRREVGVVIRHRKIARQIQHVFETDWALTHPKDDDDKDDKKEKEHQDGDRAEGNRKGEK